MSAETLRRAASLMRERAEAATPTEWDWCLTGPFFVVAENDPRGDEAFVASVPSKADAAHIASWQPAVAIAVADWLDLMAYALNARLFLDDSAETHAALTVARAYLGESA